jgi:hypothetical protein
VILKFPKRDVITQAELAVIAAIERHFDKVLELLYKRFRAGARIEPGPLTVNMRRRPIPVVGGQDRRAG